MLRMYLTEGSLNWFCFLFGLLGKVRVCSHEATKQIQLGQDKRVRTVRTTQNRIRVSSKS